MELMRSSQAFLFVFDLDLVFLWAGRAGGVGEIEETSFFHLVTLGLAVVGLCRSNSFTSRLSTSIEFSRAFFCLGRFTLLTLFLAG